MPEKVNLLANVEFQKAQKIDSITWRIGGIYSTPDYLTFQFPDSPFLTGDTYFHIGLSIMAIGKTFPPYAIRPYIWYIDKYNKNNWVGFNHPKVVTIGTDFWTRYTQEVMVPAGMKVYRFGINPGGKTIDGAYVTNIVLREEKIS